MIKINLVVVGKVKEKYFADGIKEYSKRLSKFCDFNIIELAEENYSHVSESIIQKIKETEGERIREKLSGYVITTAIEGKKYTSEKLAEKINQLSANGNGVITFVIGGSYGVDNKIKAQSNELMSFSDMTFPHTLFRLMLTEQIYRAFSILANSPYHK